MEKLLEMLATGLTRMTSRRGFLGSTLRGVVGMGLGAAFLVGGKLAFAEIADIGCAPDYAAPPGDPPTACPRPYGSGKYGQPNTNCHWDAGRDDGRGDSDKYGCRPRSHTPGDDWNDPGNDDRPYCQDLMDSSGHPLQCNNMSGGGPPTCPGSISNPRGYWTCCCNGEGDGSKGSTKSYCYDCNEFPYDPSNPHHTGKRCICLKTVPGASSCQ